MGIFDADEPKSAEPYEWLFLIIPMVAGFLMIFFLLSNFDLPSAIGRFIIPALFLTILFLLVRKFVVSDNKKPLFVLIAIAWIVLVALEKC